MRVNVTPIERALVTGASAGLGEEFARQLARRGTDLVIVARRAERLHSLATALQDEHSVKVEVLAADLTDPSQLETVENRLSQVESPVDLLVNNAGFGGYGRFDAIDLDRHAHMLDLNVTALTRLSRVLLPELVRRARGGLINVASTAAFQPDPYGAVYGATKAYVLSFSQALHEEVKKDGVRVTVVAPGFTETEFQQVADVHAEGMPALARMGPGPVVRAALDGFAKGRAVVVPGAVNKVMAVGAATGPMSVARKVSGWLHGNWAR